VLSTALCEQRGTFLTSLVGYGVTVDFRNDYFNPTRGWYVTASQDFAGLGGDVNFVKSDLEGAWYHGFAKDLVLAVTGTAGYVTGWAGDSVRINDRYFHGGLDFPGFETAGIGPRDTSFIRADALGGKLYGIGSFELQVPNFLPEQYGIKTSLFTYVGTLGKLDKTDRTYHAGDLDCVTPRIPDPSDPTKTINNLAVPGTRNTCIRDDLSLRASAGISVYWKSPMGPLRFDFSRIIKKEPYDKTELFRFSTNTRFQ
jgi:outer membrane protein insertion porin family